MENKLTIQVWSEIECPWCWVGKRRIESALARVPFRQHVEIVYRAFRLMPGVPVQPVEQVFASKYGRIVDTASALGGIVALALLVISCISQSKLNSFRLAGHSHGIADWAAA